MSTPSLDNVSLKNVLGVPVCTAIQRGLFTSVTKTNARMLFRSAIPILQLSFNRTDWGGLNPEQADDRLTVRLTQIASFGPLMDHAARFYVTQNSVADEIRRYWRPNNGS